MPRIEPKHAVVLPDPTPELLVYPHQFGRAFPALVAKARIYAFPMTKVPARVVGAVAAVMGMAIIIFGRPAYFETTNMNVGFQRRIPDLMKYGKQLCEIDR